MENVNLITRYYAPDIDGIDVKNYDGAKGTLKRVSLKTYNSVPYGSFRKSAQMLGLLLPVVVVKNSISDKVRITARLQGI